jgi:hypothetical protein
MLSGTEWRRLPHIDPYLVVSNGGDRPTMKRIEWYRVLVR